MFIPAWRWLRRFWREVLCLSSCAVGILEVSLRSFASVRWALFWLGVLSPICFLSWYFMPPDFAINTAKAEPWKFLAVKANVIYIVPALAIMAKAIKEAKSE